MADKLHIIPTTGQIARQLKRSHRVEYAIRTRNIPPDCLAGNARLFGEEAIEQIKAALRDMNFRRDIRATIQATDRDGERWAIPS